MCPHLGLSIPGHPSQPRPDECPRADDDRHDDEHESGHLRRDDVERDGAAHGLRETAQSLRHAQLERGLEVLDVCGEAGDDLAGLVCVEEGDVLGHHRAEQVAAESGGNALA